MPAFSTDPADRLRRPLLFPTNGAATNLIVHPVPASLEILADPVDPSRREHQRVPPDLADQRLSMRR